MNGVRRRLVGGAIAALLASPISLAQTPSRVFRVVLFSSVGSKDREAWLGWFAQHDFREGSNLAFTIVNPNEMKAGELEQTLRAIVMSRPDLICVPTTTWTLAFARLTKDIPIVFFNVADPVRAGFAESFSRPGGNLTGTSNRAFELQGKQLELLIEIKPTAKRVAVLLATDAVDHMMTEELLVAATHLGMQLVEVDVSGFNRDAESIARSIKKARVDAVLYATWRTDLATPSLLGFLQRASLPAVFREWWMVESGGLISLGYPPGDAQRAVAIAARVLRGEKPATIPVDQLAKFHLAVNLRTARSMKIKVPESILLRADQVIE
jgi:putative ABC transport system substrate-binding protein